MPWQFGGGALTNVNTARPLTQAVLTRPPATAGGTDRAWPPATWAWDLANTERPYERAGFGNRNTTGNWRARGSITAVSYELSAISEHDV
ncbi:MAG: hypothetical protein K1X52_13270 [Pyrinomonadaceae bacterium]|nr:hypothetical protein [Pyrinomonadaceae bacterium]